MPSVYVTDPGGANRLLPLVHIMEVDSTNTACMSRLRDDAAGAFAPTASPGGSDAWCALWTDKQTAGRGRQGRVWHSQPGASLCLSVGRRLPTGQQAHPALTVALGAAVVRVLGQLGCAAMLKWPNDIVLALDDTHQSSGAAPLAGGGGGGREEANNPAPVRFGKLGGILCEASSAGAGAQTLLVAGVGINLKPFDLASEMATTETARADAGSANALPRVSLQDSGVTVAASSDTHSSVQSLALALAQALTDILAIASDGSALSAWCEQAGELDAWKGRALCVHERGGIVLEGVSEGVAPDGQYRLRTDQGPTLLSIGELSLRLPRSQAAGVLLIDIGNTRLKWCVADADGNFLTEPGHVSSHAHSDAVEADHLFTRIADTIGRLRIEKICDVTSIRLARVGPQQWLALFSEFAQVQSLGLQVIQSTGCHGPLRNAYDEPAQLGVDRFLGALAVAHSFSGRAAVIVSAGTATTVDAVDAEGCFRGGYILPGPQMMATSLHQNTAQLPQVGPQWALFPQNTPQAIASGIVQAQAGAVRGMLSALHGQSGEEPLLVLTGGARQWLRPVFESAREREWLVLEGLSVWGRYTGS